MNLIQQAMQFQDELVRICPVSSPWSRRLGWGPGNIPLREHYILLGRTLAELGQAEEAKEAFRKASDIDINENEAEMYKFYKSAFDRSLYDVNLE